MCHLMNGNGFGSGFADDQIGDLLGGGRGEGNLLDTR